MSTKFVSDIARFKETETKLIELVDWANDNPWFDQKFILDLYNLLEMGGAITLSQADSIDSLHERFIDGN